AAPAPAATAAATLAAVTTLRGDGLLLLAALLLLASLLVLQLLVLLLVGEVGQRWRRGERCDGLRARRRPLAARLAIEPLHLLLAAAKAARGAHLDLDVELFLEVRQLAAAAVLQRVGELGVQADAHRLERAG